MPIASSLPASLPVTRLQQRQAFKVRARRGERIECQRGEIWITQDGDPRDVILGAGECFTTDRAGTAVISALRDAAFVYRRASHLSRTSLETGVADATSLSGCAPAY